MDKTVDSSFFEILKCRAVAENTLTRIHRSGWNPGSAAYQWYNFGHVTQPA